MSVVKNVNDETRVCVYTNINIYVCVRVSSYCDLFCFLVVLVRELIVSKKIVDFEIREQIKTGVKKNILVRRCCEQSCGTLSENWH